MTTHSIHSESTVFKFIAPLCLSLVLFSAESDGGILVPATVTGSTTAPTLNNSGVLLQALNFGGGSLTRDGIAFLGVNTFDQNSGLLDSNPFSISMTGSVLSTATVGPDGLFETEIWTTSQSEQGLLIDGLDSNREYRIQILHGDSRTDSFNQFAGEATFTDSSLNSVQTDLTFGNAGTLASPYAVIELTVSGSTSVLYEMRTPDPNVTRGPSISAIAIHSTVPEPSGLVVWGMTCVLALCRRRTIRRDQV